MTTIAAAAINRRDHRLTGRADRVIRWVICLAFVADLEGMVALLKMPNRITADRGDDNRRIFPRKEINATANTIRMDNTIEARQFPQMTLHLRDLSLGGLSAISPTPLAKGERLAVYFPRQGNFGGWDATGRVVRCEQSTLGYRVAMEFEPMLAAA